MKLLIDENLPLSIAQKCCESVHACQLGAQLSDYELWNVARLKDLVILTKDTDFFDRMVNEGPPPKVIWLRIGNMRRAHLESFFEFCWSTISAHLEEYDLIEVFADRIEGLIFSRS